ncbi:MAG TPA: protein-disulfide reductase DsbD [Methylibium sp.]|nr:protein-disulfide reductase DsbD [Methylibium sp.]
MPLLRHLLLLLTFAWSGWVSAADDFLPPEQAFRFEARALDARTVEVAFQVEDGYYLYGEQFRFKTDGGDVMLGVPQRPPGKIKYDETFQKDVETYRGRIAIRLPVERAPAAFVLTVVSQGCADAGLCYPPMESRAELRLAGFGGDGSVRVLPPGDAGGPSAAESPRATTDGAASSGDARIDAALRGGRFWGIVGVFFVAGLLLSLTPCVLPMLPILSSIIVGPSGSAQVTRSRGLLLATAYSLGMALLYTGLGVAAGLAGEGLAAWLQTPWVLGAFALLLVLLALSMFGFYDLQLPSRWRDSVATASNRLRGGHLVGVFAMGGLSALIVSPCVAAPLAGALLYISQSRDVVIGGAALFTLAAGMSVPLLLVGASAGALLPKSGPWMEGIKRLFGVMLLVVAWWTLSPVLPPSAALAGWGLLLLVAASFLGAFDRPGAAVSAGRRLGQAGGVALAVLGAAQLLGAAGGAHDPLQPLGFVVRAVAPSALNATEESPVVSAATGRDGVTFRRIGSITELDSALQQAGKPVMLDFYADWCVSCKEMERFTFTDPAVRARLGKALLLQADVTKNTDEDRALLKRFKLFGPPGIIFFDATGREIERVRVIGFQNAERFGRSLDAAGL